MSETIKFYPNRNLPFMFGDLYQIRSELSNYELVGVQKIVNIMGGQYSENKSIREEELEAQTFSEIENEQLSETTAMASTTETLQIATSEFLNKTNSFGVSGFVEAKYGPVRAGVAGNMQSQTAQGRSRTEASGFAKTVSEKSREMVRSRAISRRSSISRVMEREEKLRGLDNRNGDPLANVYRFVEARYSYELIQHSKTMFTKFIMSDPAANYRNALEAGQVGKDIIAETVDLAQYTDPQTGQKKTLSPGNLSPQNWFELAAIFGLTDPVPPPEPISVTEIYTQSDHVEGAKNFMIERDITVPTGFVPRRVFYHYDISAYNPNNDPSENDFENFGISMMMGRHHHGIKWWGTLDKQLGPFPIDANSLVNGTLKTALFGTNFNHGFLTAEVELIPTDQAMKLWKLAFYNQLLEARRAESGTQPEESMANTLDLVEVADLSRSPTVAKQMIDNEIQLICLRYVLGTDLVGLNMVDRDVDFPNYPKIDFAKSNNLQPTLDFIKRVFDFDRMSYEFLESYLGGRAHRMAAFSSPSSGLLSKFMQAGAVDILLPVREGMELALMYFLQTGLILDGDDIPLPYDREMLALYEEIEEARDMETNEEPLIIDQWFEMLPTAHVMLQSGALLPDFRAGAVNPGAITGDKLTPSETPLPSN